MKDKNEALLIVCLTIVVIALFINSYAKMRIEAKLDCISMVTAPECDYIFNHNY